MKLIPPPGVRYREFSFQEDRARARAASSRCTLLVSRPRRDLSSRAPRFALSRFPFLASWHSLLAPALLFLLPPSFLPPDLPRRRAANSRCFNTTQLGAGFLRPAKWLRFRARNRAIASPRFPRNGSFGRPRRRAVSTPVPTRSVYYFSWVARARADQSRALTRRLLSVLHICSYRRLFYRDGFKSRHVLFDTNGGHF